MSSKIDYKEIEKIINLVEERKLSEFELEVEGFKIKIVRNIGSPVSVPAQVTITTPGKEGTSSVSVEQTQKASQEISEAKENNIYYVKAPMVGTFYRAPDPSSPPYVEEGDKVEKNQVLCIIEAMKLMNEIESEVEGVVEKILVENGQPVEYGQKLFAIRLSK
ncbi:acetyl-CoA carboxylase biotin carboxyl carrier protein [Candidatus Aminicenantes bacterium AC-335-K20]|nr:acetyl-CoA carboxylase biotin carboxyl carrier protein [SCandidatus Aminicenantes bacterium Aminicenantia_JdfR_composite]MCP2597212.1 acetyl-CoA carboxylase biotin carboxyl carrier protein [Candidatus Aminicenantes bacterium AC-335-G13]MCP2598481.1 acetyl-CoA carboxylase biotin carboxyl carrier protein [Candidatus Aminicenantes bacterium AC-335-L06]MCP2618694.1 acetyl-CoA carboxylase biotin carboxyl carrier protein [Candidatus Aminicenantes bacterium AC-335-A11]MCP2619521.1 acetyl-CoA carbox